MIQMDDPGVELLSFLSQNDRPLRQVLEQHHRIVELRPSGVRASSQPKSVTWNSFSSSKALPFGCDANDPNASVRVATQFPQRGIDVGQVLQALEAHDRIEAGGEVLRAEKRQCVGGLERHLLSLWADSRSREVHSRYVDVHTVDHAGALPQDGRAVAGAAAQIEHSQPRGQLRRDLIPVPGALWLSPSAPCHLLEDRVAPLRPFDPSLLQVRVDLPLQPAPPSAYRSAGTLTQGDVR